MINNSYEILSDLKAGNSEAFEIIYKQYYRGLFAFASQYVDRVECEEIIQDVMMWLWENHSMIVPELSLKSLLFTSVKNRCLNKITHKKIKLRVHEKLYEKYKEKFEDPDFYMEGEILNVIAKAISELPNDYREAFELNRFESLTYNEIAERKHVSAKTIAYRISQALKILRVKLKDYMLLII